MKKLEKGTRNFTAFKSGAGARTCTLQVYLAMAHSLPPGWTSVLRAVLLALPREVGRGTFKLTLERQ